MKTLIRAAVNKQKGRMRPAGRQFDMPVLVDSIIDRLGVKHVLEQRFSNFLASSPGWRKILK